MCYLWRLVVNGQDCHVKADARDGAALLVGDGEHKLDVARVQADVQDGRHVGHLHEVHSMLQPHRHTGVFMEMDNTN